MEWRFLFPGAEVYAFLAVGSDHSPILIQTSIDYSRTRKPIMFESYWNEDEECHEVIYRAWNSIAQSQASFLCKVRWVTVALKVWSRKKFSNRHKKVLILQNQLRNVVNQPHFHYDKAEAAKLKEEIHRSWRQEEQYWALCSRILWLKCGNKNTRFFHASTIQRRQRNRITTLLNDDN